MLWFYTHCVIAIVILIADARGTLEPAVNKFEEKVGIYTVPDTTKIDTFTIEIDKTPCQNLSIPLKTLFISFQSGTTFILFSIFSHF